MASVIAQMEGVDDIISSKVENDEQLDFDHLCDRRLQFKTSKTTQDVIGIEIASHSKYFERLLCYHHKQDFIEIPEMLRPGFKELLRFIRAGNVGLDAGNVYSVFLVADYMLVKGLKELCLDLMQKLADEPVNAMQLWLCCRDYHWVEIAQMAFDKLLRNFEGFSETNEFLDLHAADLVAILSNDGLEVRSEKVVFYSGMKWLSYDARRVREYASEVFICTRIGLLTLTDWEEIRRVELAQRAIDFHTILQQWPNCTYKPHNELLSRHLLQLATPRLTYKVIFVFGGWDTTRGPRAATQVYDYKADLWTMWSPESQEVNTVGLIPTRVYAGCVAVGDRIYLIGGYDGNAALKCTMCYDLADAEPWYEISCMNERRYYVAAVHCEGFIYALGGHTGDNNSRLSSAEHYDITRNLWVPITDMSCVRSDASAAAFAGHVYVVGGFDGRHYHNTAECYDPQTDQWTLLPNMTTSRGGVACLTLGHYMYCVGGNDGSSRLKSIERYDFDSATWELVGSMETKKSNTSVVLINQEIYIIGGWSDEEPSGGILGAVEKFIPEESRCVTLCPMTFAASATCACVVAQDQCMKYVRRNPPYRELGHHAGGGQHNGNDGVSMLLCGESCGDAASQSFGGRRF